MEAPEGFGGKKSATSRSLRTKAQLKLQFLERTERRLGIETLINRSKVHRTYLRYRMSAGYPMSGEAAQRGLVSDHHQGGLTHLLPDQHELGKYNPKRQRKWDMLS